MRRTRVVMEVVRTLAAIIAAAALLFHSGPSKAQSALTGPWSFDEQTVDTLMVGQGLAWKGACVLTKTACEGIPPPYVGYALLWGRLGTYQIGTRTVLVDLRLLGQTVSVSTMVHEMVHYLQSYERADPFYVPTPDSPCRDEKEAHDLTREFVKMTGIGKGDPRVLDWSEVAVIYKCLLDGRSFFAPKATQGPP